MSDVGGVGAAALYYIQLYAMDEGMRRNKISRPVVHRQGTMKSLYAQNICLHRHGRWEGRRCKNNVQE